MKRLGVATLAFYIGIICMIVGVIARAMGFRILDIKSINFIHFANAWFLICLAAFLNAIYQKISEKKE